MNKNAMRIFGIHPLAALAFIAIDMMLFAPDVSLIGWTISLSVGLALIIPCAILQRYVCGDSWVLAIAKGVILGILTAIPTPLPAFITGGSGICGYLNRNQKLQEQAGKQPPELEP
jgi:hypothetical protein